MADGNAVAVQEAPQAPAVTSEAGALISMIERAARDPSVDIAKMERLFDMQSRMEAERARREFLVAFNAMQPHLPVVEKNGRIVVPGKNDKADSKPAPFARYEDIDAAARPVYTEHGFSVGFDIEQTPDRITAICVLGHIGGHVRRVSFSSPIESSGFKNNTQGWGSALQYCKRYSFCAALNIVTKGVDDDGKAAGAPETISEEQAATLREWIEITSSDQAAFCAYYKVAKLSDLPATKFDAAVNTFKTKQKKQAANG